MEFQAIAQRYFDAWNRHDSSAIAASFAEDGTYSDPTTGGLLSGNAIVAYAAGLFAAFPDLAFELVSAAPAGEDMIAAQWLMRGTNTAPFNNAPPTGNTVVLPGADFITIEGDRIRSVQGYFDQKAFVEQLNLHVILAPFMLHPVTTPPPEAAAADKGAYVPALWEHPTLCVSVFGLQYLTPEGQQLYAEAGIQPEIFQSLEKARQDGLLGYRYLHAPDEAVIMQYWRSYEDMDRWARTQPHSRWWVWLNEHIDAGLGFYHEIYQAKTAEAIFTGKARPVGAATISSLQAVSHGKGHSRERQARFAAAAEAYTPAI
jgi:steroid delta-isomerase-like uncharacterized protein